MAFSNPKYIDGANGSNSNDGSEGSPWETLANGLSQALSDGTIDALLLADGTYKDGDYSIASLTDLYIGPQNWGSGTNVIIQNNNASDDRIFATNSGTNNVVFGRLTLDAEGKDHILRTGGTSGTGLRVIFAGTHLENFAEAAVRSGGSTYFIGPYRIFSDQLDGVGAPTGVQFDPDANDHTFLIGGQGEIDVTGGPTSTLTGVSIIPDSAVTGTSVIIEDGATIKVTRDDRTSNDGLRGISIGISSVSVGFEHIYIGQADIDLEGSDEPIGIIINGDKTATHRAIDRLTVRKPNIKNNSFEALGTAGGGYGINIGGEFDIASDTVGEVVITRLDYEGATVDGFDHGIYFGGLNGHNIGYGSRVKNSALGFTLEGCEACTGSGAFITDPADSAACLRLKDTTNSNLEHNTVVVTSTSFTGDGIEERDGSTPTSTGNTIRNNNIVFPASLSGTPRFVDSDANTLAQSTYTTNNYYRGGDAFAGTDFNDEGVDRTLAAWITNVESTAENEAGTTSSGGIPEGSFLAVAGSVNAVAEQDHNGRFFAYSRPIGAFIAGSTALVSSAGGGSQGIISTSNIIG